MKIAAMIGGGVVALLIGIAVGMTLKEPSGPTDTTSAAEVRRLELEVERRGAALAAAEAREKTLRETMDGAGVEPESPDGAPSDPAAEEPPSENAAESGAEDAPGARFLSETYPCLDRVNWEEVGTSLSEMPALIAGVARQILAEESPDPASVGRISQLNGKLITAALTIKDELPGHAPNGFFTDPAFMLNAIAETLVAAELPLDEGQLAALERTARSAMDRDRVRREGYDETTYAIRRIWEEAALKDRFFDDAFAILSPAQATALEPEEVRRRIRLSLFSSGTLLVVWSRPFPFDEPPEVVARLLRSMPQSIRLSEQEEGVAREVIERWLGSVPYELMNEPGDALDLEGMVETSRVIAWAKQTEALLETLAGSLSLDADGTEKLRAVQAIPVPVKRPAEGR